MNELSKQYSDLLTLGITIGVFCLTISKSKLFASFRESVRYWSGFLHDLVSCYFCLSQWVSFGVAMIYRPHILNSGIRFFDFISDVGVMVGVSSIFAAALFKMIS